MGSIRSGRGVGREGGAWMGMYPFPEYANLGFIKNEL